MQTFFDFSASKTCCYPHVFFLYLRPRYLLVRQGDACRAIYNVPPAAPPCVMQEYSTVKLRAG